MHQKLCSIIKKILPFIEVAKTVFKFDKMATKEKEREEEIQLLEYSLSFVEHQCGDRIVDQPYRQRGFDRVDNWIVELDTLVPICIKLAIGR
jgi:hypothetical protein